MSSLSLFLSPTTPLLKSISPHYLSLFSCLVFLGRLVYQLLPASKDWSILKLSDGGQKLERCKSLLSLSLLILLSSNVGEFRDAILYTAQFPCFTGTVFVSTVKPSLAVLYDMGGIIILMLHTQIWVYDVDIF